MLAERSGVSPRTIAAVESGQRVPTLAVLQRIVAAAGLELSLETPPPPVDDATQRHLRLSLSVRLHRALGGGGVPYRTRAAGPAWRQLARLAACGRVILHDDAALAMWLPPVKPIAAVSVCFESRPPREVPETPDVQIRPPCEGHAAAVVAVSVEAWMLGVDPPADMALSPEYGAHRPSLRAVALLLHDRAARDASGRRVRAHADPQHLSEQDDVFHTKRFRQLAMPQSADRRGWRLDDDAALSSWLRRYGYPV